MLNKVVVNNPDDLKKTIEANKGNKVWLLFTASKDKDGISWCPDCNVSQPVIDKCLKDLESTIKGTFVTIYVGQRPEWKDPNNFYRTSPEFTVKCIPTLLLSGQKNVRLEEASCADPGLVSMFLKE